MNDVVGLGRYPVRQGRIQKKEPDPTSDSLALIASTPMLIRSWHERIIFYPAGPSA